MPTIEESPLEDIDLNQYFDFEQSGSYEPDEDFSIPPSDALDLHPSYSGAVKHPCTAADGSHLDALQYGLSSSLPIESVGIDPLDNFDDFSKWLPTYKKPGSPCEYCKSRDLECFITFDGQTACSPCNALFRECSFTKTYTPRSDRASGGYLDTLHPVTEDVAHCQGNLTSRRPLFTLGASMDEVVEDLFERRPEKNSSRFPRAVVSVLKKWLDDHSSHPYPTEDEKEALKDRTGLTKGQISNWLANARRRGKIRPARCVSPSIKATRARPIDIPGGFVPVDTRSPMQRWKESPPDHEPARVMDIARAVATTRPYTSDDPDGSSSASHSYAEQRKSSSAGSALSGWREPSTTSLETGKSEGSRGSKGSAWSHSSSRGSYNSFAKRDRRRRRRTNPGPQQSSAKKRPFQCTFCTDTFVSKHDWSRHEQSVHLSTEKWICAPLGPIITTSIPANGGPPTTQCVYCQAPNPTPDHVERHNHEACEEKGLQARTFYRKDHLRQHLRLVHAVPLTPAMEAWKSTPTYLRSRCGFCREGDVTFSTWTERADHLSKHFRSGATMADWRGSWGFDPEVTAQVANAMPPFLIGSEQKTMIPFSGTVLQQSGGIGQQAFHDLPKKSTDGAPANVSSCWEVLTLMLGQFAQQQKQLGVVVSDEALQHQAREILYGDQDGWNQTAADNPEWLALFKQAHGLVNEQASPESFEAVWAATSQAGPASIDNNIFSGDNIFGDLVLDENSSALDLATFGNNQTAFDGTDGMDLGGLQ